MKRLIRLLVIEDEVDHIIDAENYFASREEMGCVSIEYARTLEEAENIMRKGKYDGIISDIFFPTGFEEDESRRRILELRKDLTEEYLFGYRGVDRLDSDRHKKEREQVLAGIDQWSLGETEPPSGVLLTYQVIKQFFPQGFDTFKSESIPITLNTNHYYRNIKMIPVDMWHRHPYISTHIPPIVKTGISPEVDGEHKDWRKAYILTVCYIDDRLKRYREDTRVVGWVLADEPAPIRILEITSDTPNQMKRIFMQEEIINTLQKAKNEMTIRGREELKRIGSEYGFDL